MQHCKCLMFFRLNKLASESPSYHKGKHQIDTNLLVPIILPFNRISSIIWGNIFPSRKKIHVKTLGKYYLKCLRSAFGLTLASSRWILKWVIYLKSLRSVSLANISFFKINSQMSDRIDVCDEQIFMTLIWFISELAVVTFLRYAVIFLGILKDLTRILLFNCCRNCNIVWLRLVQVLKNSRNTSR